MMIFQRQLIKIDYAYFLIIFIFILKSQNFTPIRKSKILQSMSSFDEDSLASDQSNVVPEHTFLLAEITAKVARYSQQIIQIILQSMSNPTIPPTQAQKKLLDGCEARKTTAKISPHRKNKMLSNLQGSIQRPKMPTSSFLHYYHANKKALAEQWGEKNAAKLTKLASISWRELIPEEKSKYTQLSQQSKLRYQKEMTQFRISQHVQPSQAIESNQIPKMISEEHNRINFINETPELPVP